MVLLLLLLLLRLGDHDHLRLRGLLLTHSRVLRLGVVGPFLLDWSWGRHGLLLVLALAGYLVDVIAAEGSVSRRG